jgi:hypothetical protein
MLMDSEPTSPDVSRAIAASVRAARTPADFETNDAWWNWRDSHPHHRPAEPVLSS